jgi:hypothetical protein
LNQSSSWLPGRLAKMPIFGKLTDRNLPKHTGIHNETDNSDLLALIDPSATRKRDAGGIKKDTTGYR